MSFRRPTEQSFLADVAKHKMTILMEQGEVYRHLLFKEPGNSNQYFELLTSPGQLVFSGDMGTLVFERTTDMFNFFRRSQPGLAINPSYWAEKLQAPSSSGVEEFDDKQFTRCVVADLVDWIRANYQETTKEERRELWDAVMCDVLSADGEIRKQVAVHDFYHHINDDFGGFTFVDFGEHRCTDYSYRYIWSCYAIVWAIQQWDAAKAEDANK